MNFMEINLFSRYRKWQKIFRPLTTILSIALFILTATIIYMAISYEREILSYYKNFKFQYVELVQWLKFVIIFSSYIMFLLIIGFAVILMSEYLLFLPGYYAALLLIASQFGVHFLSYPGYQYLEKVTRSKLETLVLQYGKKNSSNEMDRIQKQFNCCGNKYYNDWLVLGKPIPGSCCDKEFSERCDDGAMRYGSGMSTKLSCSDNILWTIQHKYILLSTLSLISLMLQIILFVLISALLFLWQRRSTLPSQRRYPLQKDFPDPTIRPPTTKTTLKPKPIINEPCYPWGRTKRKLPGIRTKSGTRSPPPKIEFAQPVGRNPKK